MDPTKLFAAMPITVVTLAAKQKTAAALSAQGVPMGGSSAATTPRGDASSGGDGSSTGDNRPVDHDRIPPRTRRRARVLALMGVAVVVVLVALVLWEGTVGDGRRRGGEEAAAPRREAAPATTTTTLAEGDLFLTPRPGTSGGAVAPIPAVTSDEEGPAAAGDPEPDDPAAATVPPLPPPTVPPPPPAAPQGSISAAPSRVATVHPNGQAVISWSTTGATSVSVSGPGLSSSSASGSQSVCPGAVVSSVCRSQPGTYVYVLTVSGPGGSVRRQATLTVG